eukprot:12970602-Alexandrium_andersonii.AAC.1
MGRDDGRNAHDGAGRDRPDPAATAATGRRRARRAALLCRATRGRDAGQAASRGGDAPGSCTGMAPLRDAGRRHGE